MSDGATLEEKLIPPFILLSISVSVACMCFKSWLVGCYGDVVVTQISPWFLCNVGCLQCTNPRPHIDCFWMENWANTGFDVLGVIQHLEYWCLGALVLAFIPALFTCVGPAWRSKHCGVDLHRPVLLLLIVAAILSTISISLFSTKYNQGMDTISNYQDLASGYGLPYFIRILATIFIWCGTLISVVHECKMKSKVGTEMEDTYTIVTQSRTIEDVLDDENEEEGELL